MLPSLTGLKPSTGSPAIHPVASFASWGSLDRYKKKDFPMRGSSILTILETSCWSGWGLSLWGGFPWKEAQCQSSRWILTLTLNLLSILAQNLNAFSFGQNNGFSIFSNLRPGWLLRDSPTTVLDILLRWRESWWFWWFSRWGPTHRTSATLLTGSYCHHIR